MRHLTSIKLNRVTKEITKRLERIYSNAERHIQYCGNYNTILYQLDFFSFLKVSIDEDYNLLITEHYLDKKLRDISSNRIYDNKIPIDFKGNIKYDMISDFINQYNINKEFFKL